MDFTSDNSYGIWPEMLEALSAAARGSARSYGADEITARLTERFSQLFEREVVIFPVISGTAANALALAAIVPPHGAVICHAESHIAVDECGAPEFFTHGAKLIGIESANGKLDPGDVRLEIERRPRGIVHHVQPRAVSVAQVTEAGTVYRPVEIAALAGMAHGHGLKFHMDGARLANAVASLGCTPAETTWRAGVDVLSFGATKNGAMAAEAVLFFNKEDAADFEYRRKRAGHLISKMRFVSAQLETYIEDRRWLPRAARANALAKALAAGLAQVPGAVITQAVEANLVFVTLPEETIRRLIAAGAKFIAWSAPAGGRTLLRLVTSFATPEEDVARFVSVARG